MPQQAKRVKATPDVLKAVMDAITENVEEAAQKVTLRFANRIAGRIRQTIVGQTQGDSWPPLSPPYAAWKKRKDLDPRMLYATGEYVQSIRARAIPGRKAYVVSPAQRVHKNKIYKGRNNLTLDRIGAIHEFGAVVTSPEGKKMVIPARPHWRPVLDDVRKNEAQWQKDFSGAVWAQIIPKLVDRIEAIGGSATL